MNAARRKEIEKAVALIEVAHGMIEQAMADEQDYYDNMPESLQGGEKGDVANNAIEQLDTAMNSLDEATSAAQDAMSS